MMHEIYSYVIAFKNANTKKWDLMRDNADDLMLYNRETAEEHAEMFRSMGDAELVVLRATPFHVDEFKDDSPDYKDLYSFAEEKGMEL